MNNDEHLLKDLLQQFIDKSGKQKLYDERRVLTLWNEKMEEAIKQHCRCLDIKNGVLKIKVDSAALRFEMMARRCEIIKQLNEWSGGEVVKDIFFSF
ncbi:MAG: DUF721 domain-containing protein [Bacteroidales bacterium]|nr:DUF721 domain-containing protein [Bacteroidales bacterium]